MSRKLCDQYLPSDNFLHRSVSCAGLVELIGHSADHCGQCDTQLFTVRIRQLVQFLLKIREEKTGNQ